MRHQDVIHSNLGRARNALRLLVLAGFMQAIIGISTLVKINLDNSIIVNYHLPSQYQNNEQTQVPICIGYRVPLKVELTEFVNQTTINAIYNFFATYNT